MTEPSIIAQVWAIPAALAGAFVAPRLIWALFWSAFIYVAGKVILDIEGLNPNGLVANQYEFTSGWWANLFGQLIVVWLLAAGLWWLANRRRAILKKD